MTDEPERGHHFLRILEEGKRFTTELLKENEALRLTNLKLRDELRERDERARDNDVERLRRERDDARAALEGLRQHLAAVEADNQAYAERYTSIERQNSNLASLYVATYNLHSTLKLDEVLTHIREIVVNLIGSELFGVYVLNDEATGLVLATHEGLEDPRYRTLPRSAVLDRALSNGGAVAIDAPDGGDGKAPIACAPLVIQSRVLGVIAIYRLLDHKARFEDIDRELLDLLAGHAATALYSAKLHQRAERRLTTLEGFLSLVGKG